MNYLITFVLFFLFLIVSIAQNYMPENKGNTVWVNKDVCEKESGQTCYAFDPNIDPETLAVKDVEIDDVERPLYAMRTNETDCILWDPIDGPYPETACVKLIESINTGEIVFPLCSDSTYFATYANKSDFGLGDGFFAYCTKVIDYEKKIVKRLVEDNTLIDNKNQILLDRLETGKAKKVLDLILKRMACDEVLLSSQASQKLKNKVTEFKQAINAELQGLLDL